MSLPLPTDRIRSLIVQVAGVYTLNPDLVEAIIIHESAGVTSAIRYEQGFWVKYMAKDPRFLQSDPHRVSSSYGLMQVMYVVALEVGFTSPDPEYLFVPSIGLDTGCKKLKQLLDWAQGVEAQALAAYNGGKGANSKPPYRNQVYADAVLAIKTHVSLARRPVSVSGPVPGPVVGPVSGG
jgi:soluble lytic murein transglycosylase-like protein